MRQTFSPKRPDINLPLLIHRPQTDKHVIPIARKTERGWEEVAVRAVDLREWFPEFSEQFKRDSYFGINGMFAAISRTSGRARMSSRFEGAFQASRSSERLHTLNACYADLDCYKVGMTPGQVVGELIDMEDRGELPPMSIILLSGRGVWPMWLLRDKQHTGPVVSWREKVQIYNQMQKHITQKKLAHLGADDRSRDAARVARIPGTLNSTAGERVRFHLIADERGNLILHDLDELAKAFKLPRVSSSRRCIPNADPVKRVSGQKGHVSRWYKCLRMVHELAAMRGLHPVGARHSTTYIYSGCLARVCKGAAKIAQTAPEKLPEEWSDFATMSEPDIISAVLEFARANCEQPDTDPMDLRQVAINARKAINKPFLDMPNQTVSNYCRITPEESAQLKQLGFDFPPMNDGQPIAAVETPTPADRKQLAQDRRAIIEQAIQQHGRVPTGTELAQWLDKAGIRASAATIQADIRAMGIVNPRSKKARGLMRPSLFK
jgi:hypothetical protein